MPIYNASKQRMLLRENRNEAYGQSRNVHKLKQIYFSMEAEAQFKEEKYYGNGSTAQSYSDER